MVDVCLVLFILQANLYTDANNQYCRLWVISFSGRGGTGSNGISCKPIDGLYGQQVLDQRRIGRGRPSTATFLTCSSPPLRASRTTQSPYPLVIEMVINTGLSLLPASPAWHNTFAIFTRAQSCEEFRHIVGAINGRNLSQNRRNSSSMKASLKKVLRVM